MEDPYRDASNLNARIALHERLIRAWERELTSQSAVRICTDTGLFVASF